jgi:DNA-binding NtrC family response regulator
LRSRPDDIPLLFDHFVAEVAEALGKEKPAYPKKLGSILASYDFPGNVRELQAMVHDLVVRNTEPTLPLELVQELIGRERAGTSSETPQPRDAGKTGSSTITFHSFPTLKEAEAELIRRALEMAGGNQRSAATLLGITRQALNNRLRRNRSSP